MLRSASITLIIRCVWTRSFIRRRSSQETCSRRARTPEQATTRFRTRLLLINRVTCCENRVRRSGLLSVRRSNEHEVPHVSLRETWGTPPPPPHFCKYCEIKDLSASTDCVRVV